MGTEEDDDDGEETEEDDKRRGGKAGDGSNKIIDKTGYELFSTLHSCTVIAIPGLH